MVDDYSRAIWVFLLKDKSETFQRILHYFLEHGIIHEISYVDTPQQKERVERKN